MLVALANRANEAGECWPSLAGIALNAGTTERGAQKALRELEQLRLIQTDRETGRTSRYRLAVGEKTSEPGSPLNDASPPNVVHPTPERRSPPPPNVVPKPPNDVHPNRIETQSTTQREPKERDASAEDSQPTLIFDELPQGQRRLRRKAPRRQRGSPISPDWRPDQAGLDYAVRHGVVDVNREIEKFVNHYVANMESRPNWPGSWRTWCDKFLTFNGNQVVAAKARARPTGGLFSAVARMYEPNQMESDND